MNIRYFLALTIFISASSILAMDVGALYRQTQDVLEQVPASQVILVSAEGKEFELPQNVAEQSITLKGMIEDIGANRKINLANISNQTLAEIVNLLNSLHQHQNLQDKALLDALEKDITIKDPFAILAAANYLDVQPIMELAARAIARQEMISRKGHTYSINAGPLRKETHDKLFKIFGNDKQNIVLLVARYFFLLSGKKFTDVPENLYGFSIQDYLDYKPNNTEEVLERIARRQPVGQYIIIESDFKNLNSLKGLSALATIKNYHSIILNNFSLLSSIKEIDLAGLDHVDSLEIVNSALKEIPVSALKQLPKLGRLVIDGSKIKVISENMRELKKLLVFKLDRSEIIEFPNPTFLPPNLKTLSLMENNITHIPHDIGILKHLINLILMNNKITHIDQKTIGVLAQMPALNELTLILNPLTPETQKALRDALGNKVKLRDLYE